MNDFDQVAQYPTLTDSQRIQARRNAERNIAEKYARKPRREDFNDYTVSRFPGWFSLAIAGSLLFIAIAAGMISAFRLYYAGYEQFYTSIANADLARIVGVLTPTAAEILVIVSAIARQMYLYQNRRGARVALIPMVMGTVLAFVGNWHIAQPDSMWAWADTVFPPVAVLSVALFFELTLIPELERRQANENAYKAARDKFDTLLAAPNKHPSWQDTYGWALWEMWANVYKSQFDILSIERTERQMIAMREMDADAFFSSEIAAYSVNSTRIQPDKTLSAKQLVVNHLRANPEVFTSLNSGEIQQSEVAAQLGVSQASVSRGIAAYSKNGFS